MIVEKATERIQQILGFRSDLEREILDALNEAQEDLESGLIGLLPWFLFEQEVITMLEGDSEMNLPDKFLREYEHARSPLWVPECGPVRKAVYSYGSAEQGNLIGLHYWVDGETIHVNGTANKDIDFTYLYYKGDEKLIESGDENKWMKHASRLMIGIAGGKMSGVQDFNAMQTFMNMESTGQAMLIRQDTAQRNFRPQMGKETYRTFDRYNFDNDFDFGD